MTHLPSQAAIDAAESRLVQSRLEVRQSVERTRSAVRAAMARPSTVALVALASGVSAFLVSHRLRPVFKSAAKRADSPTSESTPSLARTLVSMYGAAVLSYLLQHGAVVWKQFVASVSTKTPGTSAAGDFPSKRDQ